MSTDDPQGGFLSRWSRRKAQARQEAASVPSTPASPSVAAAASVSVAGGSDASLPVTPPVTPTRVPAAQPDAAPGADPRPGEQAYAPKGPARPTLEDVEQLDAQSDYRSFVARDVDPEVRNAAFRKLFHSDPHFNVMDGLDVYIDDYNTPTPLPVAIMKTLVQARALGLIDDELKEQEPPSTALAPAAEHPPAPAEQPVPVELVWVPDRASNDEPISAAASAGSAQATAQGSVVPFPPRPGRADPA